MFLKVNCNIYIYIFIYRFLNSVKKKRERNEKYNNYTS